MLTSGAAFFLQAGNPTGSFPFPKVFFLVAPNTIGESPTGASTYCSPLSRAFLRVETARRLWACGRSLAGHGAREEGQQPCCHSSAQGGGGGGNWVRSCACIYITHTNNIYIYTPYVIYIYMILYRIHICIHIHIPKEKPKSDGSVVDSLTLRCPMQHPVRSNQLSLRIMDGLCAPQCEREKSASQEPLPCQPKHHQPKNLPRCGGCYTKYRLSRLAKTSRAATPNAFGKDRFDQWQVSLDFHPGSFTGMAMEVEPF